MKNKFLIFLIIVILLEGFLLSEIEYKVKVDVHYHVKIFFNGDLNTPIFIPYVGTIFGQCIKFIDIQFFYPDPSLSSVQHDLRGIGHHAQKRPHSQQDEKDSQYFPCLGGGVDVTISHGRYGHHTEIEGIR